MRLGCSVGSRFMKLRMTIIQQESVDRSGRYTRMIARKLGT